MPPHAAHANWSVRGVATLGFFRGVKIDVDDVV